MILDEVTLDQAIAINIAVAGAAVGILISSLELLTLASSFEDTGINSWRVRKTRFRLSTAGVLEPFLEFLLRYPNILWLIRFRFLVALCTILSFGHYGITALLCSILLLTTLILNVHGSEGTTGADQMTTNILIVGITCLAYPFGRIPLLGAAFLSAQVLLAYATSGWIRILQPTWRDGSDLLVVLRQKTYGNRYAWNFAKRHAVLTRLASLGVLTFECIAPIAPLISTEWLVIYLGLGVAFHLMNAWIMGLNLFVWSFIPVYPAILSVAFWLQNES
jgi:hypothetical protein